jgi:acetyl-CoA carboxylase biotin carboxylase subunit
VTLAATGVRVDSHCCVGASVPPYYDSLIAKVITHGADREEALRLMDRYLERMQVGGVHTTIPLARAIVGDEEFQRHPVTTRWLEDEFMPRWEEEIAL